MILRLPRLIGLTLALGLVNSAALAQSATVDAASRTQVSPRTFDAGFSALLTTPSGSWTEWLRPGAWFGMGSSRWRLQVDYRHSQRRLEPGLPYQRTGTSVVEQLEVAVVRRFRVDRSIAPHVLGGIARNWFRSYDCEVRPYVGRQCFSGRDVSTVPVWGAGVDVAVGDRIFVRAGVRGYLDPRLSGSMEAAFVVGAGLRF